MMIRKTVCLIVIFLPVFGVAQENTALDNARASFEVGKYEEAISKYSRLLEVSGTADCLECRLGIAQSQIRLGRFDEAIQASQKVIEQAKDQRVLAEAHNLQGEAQMNKGRNDLALELLEKALSIFQKLGNDTDLELAQCYHNLALAYWNSGSKDLALQYELSVLDIRKRVLGDEDISVGDAYNSLGLFYPEEKSDESGKQYEKAYEIYALNFGSDHPKVALALNNIAIIHRNNEEYAEALEKLEQSRDIWNGIYEGDHPNKAFVDLNIGQVYKGQDQLSLALEYYTSALEMYTNIYGARHPEIANVHTLIASVLLQQNQYRASIKKYNESINANLVSQELTNVYQNPELRGYYNPNILLISLQYKARAFEGLHYNKTVRPRDMKMALQTLELCDSLITDLRQSRLNEADKITLGNIAKEVYEDAVRLNLAFSEVSLKPRYYQERAFYFAEKSKASVLLAAINDTKAKHFAGLPDDLLETESELKINVAYYDQQVAETSGSEQDNNRTKLLDATKKYNDFIKELEIDYPKYFNLKYNQDQVSITQLQEELEEGTGVLSYFTGEKEKSNTIYVFLVTKADLKYYELELMEDLQRWASGLRNGIKLNLKEIFVESSLALSKQLIPKRLPRNLKSLVIIPDGILSTIPFEVLLQDYEVEGEINFANLPYLVRDFNVSYDFSATLFHQRQSTLNEAENLQKALLVAPIDFESDENILASLPETSNEVKQLDLLFSAKMKEVKTFVQSDANETAIKSEDMQDYRYLHFATHGEINESDPRLSRIYLNPSSGNDGNLFSSEIYNLKIGADLVTLSACETGLGKVTKGEGIIGLSRALMYAGARNLIVSFWKVADKSTSELMIDFYQNHLNISVYRDYNRALRQAKLKMIKSDQYSSPYYWAPFILIGI